MTLPLRLLLLFTAMATIVAIVIWPNSVSMPFTPGQPYTGPGFEVVGDAPCPISGWIALAPPGASASASPSLAIAPTPPTTTTTTTTTTIGPPPAAQQAPAYPIVCVQPVYIQTGYTANGTVAVRVWGELIGENLPNVYEHNLYYLPVPPNASFVVYGDQAYLASKQYLMPFNYTLYVVEPIAAAPHVEGWRYVGDMSVKYDRFLEVYHLYLADATWRFYRIFYVNATIAPNPAMYYFLPRK